MLSYQHAYHAGSFADVLKHVTLCLICDYMGQKEKPLFYLETHAGRGIYDLTSPMAQKTVEYKTGAGLFWKNKEKLPAVFSSWMDVIHKYNSDTLQFYPGSPLFALHRLREQDRFNFCELHPGEFDFLKNLDNQHKSVQYLFKDGIAHMNAALPPKEKRGLIFIDPSYELKQEYQFIPDKIMQSYKKFATGVYCLWYPILNQQENQAFIKNLRTSHVENQLNIEFLLDPQPQTGMIGTGLWVINPPHILQEQMDEVLATLKLYCHF